MPSPAKRAFPPPPLTAGPEYSSVPTSAASPTLDNPPSPDPNAAPLNPYSNLSGAYLTPELTDSAQLLGRRGSDYMPAPSILSRDSTHESLLAPGTPNLPGSRNSWGSGMALAGAAEGIAGADNSRRPTPSRGQSALQHSTLGWNNTSNDRLSISDESDEQGHITPAAAAGGAGAAVGADGMSEKPKWAQDTYAAEGKRRKRKFLWAGVGVGLLLLIGLGVGLGIGLTRNKSSSAASGSGSSSDNASGSSGSGTASHSGTATSAAPSATATSGGQGSLITLENGETMTYENPFGGTWVWDEANPFNNDAQAQSYTPKLSEDWTWGVDKVYGVNLGGWLNTEPFIVPALYETYATGVNNPAVDEYTLSQNMGDNLTAAMTEHYETFITERDFAEIAAAGLNWIRLPIAHWAIETWDEEPYLERVSWTYFLKAVQWARKYGIRINLDLHTAPGSQNGWNHSGHLGQINWMSGVMGLANAQRMLDYIRTLAQFIAQPEYAPVIQMFTFINEPNAGQYSVGKDAVGAFYLEAYRIIRDITGIGAGNGPILPLHDGFIGITQWYDFLPGADRLAIDQHSYYIFGDQPTGTLTSISHRPCQWWASATNSTSQQFGINIAGEWSAASNDCGKWINNVGAGYRYDGTYAGYTGPVIGSCDYWNDHTLWNQTTKDDLKHFVLASMDALQNYFFWTWKIGNSTGPIAEVNPFWHYRLGLREGWIPSDPREAIGTCAADGVDGNEFSGTFSKPYMTGGAGAGTIAASETAAYAWPPASFIQVPSASMSLLPQYTQTGTPITMPGPTYTSPGSSATISAGNGWANAQADTRQAYAKVAGCTYPPEYSANSIAIPADACGAGLAQAPVKRGEAMPRQTPAPQR